MKKLSLSGWVFLMVPLFVTFGLFVSCKQKREEIIPSSQFASYISAYTGGIISQSSVIRVELSADLPMVELHAPLKKSPFSFSPSLKGKAWWLNNRTIEFIPDEGALRPGKLYQVTFRLGDFIDVDKEHEKFTFSFRVMDRNFAVDMDEPYIKADDPSRVIISGLLRLSDNADPAVVENMILIKAPGGQSPSLILEPGSAPDRYRFTVDGLTRTTKDEEVRIEVDGKPFGTDHQVNKRMMIPASGEFRFLTAQRISTPEQGIRVVFSDPVSTDQDLRGLVSLYGVREYTELVDGNRVDLYFDPLRVNAYTLEIDAGLHNYGGKLLGERTSISFSEEASKPEVKLSSSGTILPDSKNLLIPFSAVSLRAVDLTVVRVFENNVLMFLQDNSLTSSRELRRSGRMVYQKTLRLDQDPTKDLMKWNDFSIDLSGLIQQEPGAIYRIMLSFKQQYSLYPCGGKVSDGDLPEDTGMLTSLVAEEDVDYDQSVWDYPSTYYYMENDGYSWREYDWQQRDNPCHPSYYMLANRKASCNVLATNMGLVAKRSEGGKLWFAVADLITAKPLNQVDVTVYNFQLQPIGQAKTDSEGFASLDIKGVPFVAVASKELQKTYLKLVEGEELSVSRFDVGGKSIEKGLKGFIYGERGVWRPGDTLHVNFILEDREKRIPETHPVSLDLFTPQGQLYTRQVSSRGMNGFYSFKVPTRMEDPTGVWNAYVKVGGTAFHKSFRIETVKPNRLKIELKLPERLEAANRQTAVTLSSAWLTGAMASELKTDVELTLNRMNTQFAGYSNYLFNDPASNFESSKEQVYKGALDKQGKVTFNLQLPPTENAPGILRASLTTRVYEPGGDASIQTTSVPYSPFSAYVGINLNEKKGKFLETDQDHIFDVVTLNGAGKPVDRRNLQYRIYKIGWSWWWENRTESFGSYVHNSSVEPVASGTIHTLQGKGSISFRVNYPGWGRYLVYVKDGESGHATGGTVVVDWPDWRGRSDKSGPSGVTMLSFSTDKESYQAGETATVYIPAAAQGRALVSIESGTTVLKQEWVNVASEGDTKYQFRIEPDMAPNVYLNVTLLQPHGQTTNDLPIRMYGIVPVMVSDPDSRLEPKITMPDVLRPEQPFTLTVSEKNGRPMTYTVAIVDDGLLDLTSFRTPDPWDIFYAREALGIRTWDMYNQVVGAYSGNYGLLFSTGGDEMLKNQDAKANRFRPVVKVLGPFTLKKGGSDKHSVTLPMYVGSVRTMVVAGYEEAYGNAEKTTPVRTPLMVLATLPRVLSIGEEILLPVNVFAMEKDVKQVTVNLETSSNVKVEGDKQQSVTFTEPGDQLVMFRIKAGNATGKATIKINAGGNSYTATETIEIEIRNPNPAVTLQQSQLLDAGKVVEMNYTLSGAPGESWARLEVARIPSVDITRRFDFLYNYEHHCSEQLTSKALPLLFIDQFKEVDKEERNKIKTNVTEALRQLYGRQLPDGGFVYWPGEASANEWITSYVGNLLVVAQEKGYEVNSQVLARWKNYQKRAAQNWMASVPGGLPYDGWDLQQAYRLYTLALAGSGEPGAMNRMKEVTNLSEQARWRLAATYALMGKKDIGNDILLKRSLEEKRDRNSYRIYGSLQRDEAMILETLLLLDRDKEAFEQAIHLSERLSTESYFSTQSTAFALMAMGRLAGKVSGAIRMDWELNGKKQNELRTKAAVSEMQLPAQSGKVMLKNNGDGLLYTSLVTRQQLLTDTLGAVSEGLEMEVTYWGADSKMLDITSLQQGEEIEALIRITNTSVSKDYRDLALTHIVPSGWEIYNERLRDSVSTNDEEGRGSTSASSSVSQSYTYQDIRDDRVLTYFNLSRGKTAIFKVRLQATYAGKYVLPAIQCEAMYEPEVRSRTSAGNTEVKR